MYTKTYSDYFILFVVIRCIRIHLFIRIILINNKVSATIYSREDCYKQSLANEYIGRLYQRSQERTDKSRLAQKKRSYTAYFDYTSYFRHSWSVLRSS